MRKSNALNFASFSIYNGCVSAAKRKKNVIASLQYWEFEKKMHSQSMISITDFKSLIFIY